jgi:hypothetical protein
MPEGGAGAQITFVHDQRWVAMFLFAVGFLKEVPSAAQYKFLEIRH